MEISKAAAVAAAGTPSAAQLAAINSYAKSPLTAEQVYCFSVRLCDDQPDRDFERFDTGALPRLAALFRGKTGITDHNWSAEGQVARIFDTEVCRQEGVSFIRAWCYMLRTEENAPLIAQIEGGIRREVSVGCAMGLSRCSICGGVYGTCGHRKGVTYEGERCLAVLSEPVDAYEFSFVAVPAQREAGVLKALREPEAQTLEELVLRKGSPALSQRLQELEAEAAFGRESRKALEQEVVRLGLLLDFGADEDILRATAAALAGEQLQQLRASMAKKAAGLWPARTQLPGSGRGGEELDAAFLI